MCHEVSLHRFLVRLTIRRPVFLLSLALYEPDPTTAEDTREFSFAGQYESFLQIVGTDRLLRAIRDCWASLWSPRAIAYRKRAAVKGALGAQILAWQQRLAAHWSEARFGVLRVETEGSHHTIRVEVYLGSLDPETVAVELFAAPMDDGAPVRHPMSPTRKPDGPGDAYEYSASVSASRPAADYTPRLVPRHPEAVVPLEAPGILWQR